MTNVAFKLAVSSLVLSAALTGCPSAQLGAPNAHASAARGETPSRIEGQARLAVQQGDLPRALGHAERLVEAAPMDIGYRMLLADIYLKSGRFESAAATYRDVLELDGDNARAGLSYALTQIGLGRQGAAVGQLDRLVGTAPAADLGLAYALAGYPERAIELLEPAARDAGATPRLRQNLALSYALAGDWQRARTVAAQDVAPGDLAGRLEQWAALAAPQASGAGRVAHLLGVTPQADAGQPARLALRAPAPAEPAYAEAAPEPAPIAQAPIQFASAVPYVPAPEPLPLPAPAPEPAAEPAVHPEVDARYAAAAESLMRPEPAVIRTAPESAARAPGPVFSAVRAAARPAARFASASARAEAGPGRFAVQLGAFSNAQNAERAWQQAERSFGLAGEQPLTTTIDMAGRTLHRVSVGGFESHADASRACQSIKARGGACFVRAVAGDAAVRWAARYGPARNA
jgi:D-alanyl-D-alanine carboxypeptidase